jgi:hypothetical protein
LIRALFTRCIVVRIPTCEELASDLFRRTMRDRCCNDIESEVAGIKSLLIR